MKFERGLYFQLQIRKGNYLIMSNNINLSTEHQLTTPRCRYHVSASKKDQINPRPKRPEFNTGEMRIHHDASATQ
jgi:hypothetical protein